MLALWRTENESGHLDSNPSDLYVGDWNPEASNGAPASPWVRRDDQRDVAIGPEACWVSNGAVQPLALRDLSSEEREIYSGSVNSPIKPAVPNPTKEATPRETVGRKPSVSGVLPSPGGYNLTSPTSRPGNRRRDTNEAYPFPSTTASGMGRFTRDESHTVANPPASLIRRRTEVTKEPEPDDDKSSKADNAAPFSGLKRTTTGGAGSNGAWSGSPNTAFAPIGGAFGGFALPAGTTSAAAEKRPGFGSVRGESRFKTLMKDSLEGESSGLKGKSSLVGLGQTFESEDARSKTNNAPTGPNNDRIIGSAAIQGAEDYSPPRRAEGRLPTIGGRLDQDLGSSLDSTHQTPHRPGGTQPDTMSPTDTNPYQSPGNETDTSETAGLHRQTLPGLGGFVEQDNNMPSLMGLGALRAGAGQDSVDRSQTSSTGVKSGLGQIATLPGLGSNAGWPSGQPTAGTPTRDRLAGNFGSAFGDGIFSPVDQPSGLGFPNAFGGGAGFGGIGRGSRLPSYLPPTMQDQYRPQELSGLGSEGQFDPFQPGFSNLGRSAFNSGAMGPSRENVSPFRGPRGAFEDLVTPGGAGPMADNSASPSQSEQTTNIGAIGQRGAHNPQRQGSVDTTGSGPHAPQVRQMVLPDCMRWIYKDPAGLAQGPWSGLEMHDWYRAGFFTPELLIRKLEDSEFEPLAQLIRRIGNSREPFLVPQMGVQHEPAPSARGWSVANATGIQPPFPNSFPSFGTTLTAEQQNALERRKQEEQFLMARQKEQLAQRQFGINMQMHTPYHGAAGFQQPPLNHQPSTQSLHSQTSFSNIATPSGFVGQAGPPGQPMPGLGDFRLAGGNGQAVGGNAEHLKNVHEGDMANAMNQMNLGRGPGGMGPLGIGGLDGNHSQQVAAMLNDRARLEREQADADAGDHAAFHTGDRLQQFHDLRAREAENQHLDDGEFDETPRQKTLHQMAQSGKLSELERRNIEQSITQQVQAAVASKGSQPLAWTRVDASTMQPIISQEQSRLETSSPMPAPVAQRKQNAVDTLAAGSRSQSQTPSVDTPSASIAPWAKESVEALKGPSLKEIQEAEAKKAAHREAIAAAARKAALEKEMLLAQQNVTQPEPGLPSSSTWGNTPATPSNGASVWAKAGNGKPAPTPSGKKTLQQIQKEEEARKQRAVTQASTVATAGAPQSLSSGKRYADLASKVGAAQPQTSAWTTVGAGGKTKTPIPSGPAALGRSVSGSVATLAQAAPTKPKQPTRSTTLGSARLGQMDANHQVKQWAVNQLGSHLDKDINGKL
jgi:PERQ amino acid-rich with GYF domain-containing protein